ncbi:hypothetical protein N7474_000309 [Penicillium riverlandense]|uniref:uncharacterized protein n=1 Tax=Penicillium riverlandense TaxID=1903569 RepID=UPI0025467BAB|nr:uncharacterized protein N7474_000309 [Penicillium riverlandense]KAJ5831998.1 hypothetical protein N7474_000309 [Penicillium riverlandense]
MTTPRRDQDGDQSPLEPKAPVRYPRSSTAWHKRLRQRSQLVSIVTRHDAKDAHKNNRSRSESSSDSA